METRVQTIFVKESSNVDIVVIFIENETRFSRISRSGISPFRVEFSQLKKLNERYFAPLCAQVTFMDDNIDGHTPRRRRHSIPF